MKQKLLLAALSAAGLAASLAAEPSACMDITLDGIPRFPSDASESIQAALDKVRAAGGGKVTVPRGDYLAAGLVLGDNTTLHLDEGATLFGSTNIADYVTFAKLMPEGFDEEKEYAQAQGSKPSHLHSVVGAVLATNVAIEGKGAIDGRGDLYARYQKRDIRRWRGALFYRCKNVRVEGITLLKCPLWACYFKECENVVARGLTVDSRVCWENDGIDIEAKNALVEDCVVDTMDDAICLKNDHPDFLVENVEVRNCRVSSSCNFLKFGTTCFKGFRNCRIHDCKLVPGKTSGWYRHWLHTPKHRGFPGVTDRITGLGGINIEATDGGSISDVHIWNIDMTERCVQTPIFIRLERRNVRQDGSPARLENILIENVRGVGVSSLASSITGVPGLRPRNVTIRNVDIVLKGGGTASQASLPVPECERDYPTTQMFGYHIMPAYAFYLRHADDVRFENVRVRYSEREERDPVVQDDCTGVTFKDCSFQPPAGSVPVQSTKAYLRPLMETGLIERSDPVHPNSPQQKYALTKDGKRRIERVAPL